MVDLPMNKGLKNISDLKKKLIIGSSSKLISSKNIGFIMHNSIVKSKNLSQTVIPLCAIDTPVKIFFSFTCVCVSVKSNRY